MMLAGFLLADSASAHDPAYQWKTIVTPHFRVHYPAEAESFAQDAARAAEESYVELVRRLRWRPADIIHMVVNISTDSANGSARNLPYKLISLNASAPRETESLSDYDDWIYLLVAHELTHIIHIDTISGIPKWLNNSFGSWFAPNSVQPRWFVEGLAVYYESTLTGAGRVRSTYFDMMMRTAWGDNKWLSLDEISGEIWHWPQGVIPYLYGGRFVDFIARHYGEKALTVISHDYGSRIIPYAINASVQKGTERTYPELYEEFKKELDKRFEYEFSDLRERGIQKGERLTHKGQRTGQVRIAEDGSLYYIETPLDNHARLMKRSANGEEREVGWVFSDAELALDPGGQSGVLTQIEWDGFYHVYGDLFEVDLQNAETRRLTYGLRSRSPDVSKDGKTIAFVVSEYMGSRLYLAPRGDPSQNTLVADLGPKAEIYRPRFSPDGSALVFSATVSGQRDIYYLDLKTSALSPVTDNMNIEGSPVFSNDGKWILFHSDRDGIFNIYAVRADGRDLRRLTRVVGGAFEPELSPDGHLLYYRSYSSDGFDISSLQIPDIESAPEAGEATHQRPAPVERRNLSVYPSESYSPSSSLWPRAWLPSMYQDTRGSALGFSVNGTDAVGLHSYALGASWGLASEYGSFDLAYANQAFHPGLQLRLGHHLVFVPVVFEENEEAYAAEEKFSYLQLATSIPLLRAREYGMNFSIEYGLSVHNSIELLSDEPQEVDIELVEGGRFSYLDLGLSFANTQSYYSSISTERGTRLSVGVRLEHALLFSEYSSASGRLSWSQFLPMPFAERHVLALSTFVGAGVADYGNRKLFSIGGMPVSNILLDSVFGMTSGRSSLRGFPLTPYAGDFLAEAHLEYRFPLWDPERGISTLPIFFKTLHGTFFADGASISEEVEPFLPVGHASVGAELRMNLLIAYFMPVTVRLGYGQGLAADSRYQNVFLVTGGSF